MCALSTMRQWQFLFLPCANKKLQLFMFLQAFHSGISSSSSAFSQHCDFSASSASDFNIGRMMSTIHRRQPSGSLPPRYQSFLGLWSCRHGRNFDIVVWYRSHIEVIKFDIWGPRCRENLNIEAHWFRRFQTFISKWDIEVHIYQSSKFTTFDVMSIQIRDRSSWRSISYQISEAFWPSILNFDIGVTFLLYRFSKSNIVFDIDIRYR